MVAEPSDFLVPTLFVGLLMALAGSGLRMLRVAPYAVAAVQVVIALLSLNVIFAARTVPARGDPDRGRRVRRGRPTSSATARRP